MGALEITRRGVAGTVAVLIVVAVCVRLGVWQLDRHEQRTEANQRMAERLHRQVALGAAPGASDTAGLKYARATLTGEADGDRAIVLAGRSYSGAPGVHLFTPLRLGDGAVLVNLGWVPAPDGATADIDSLRLRGRYRVEGVLLPFPDIDTDVGRDGGFITRWFRLDGDAIRAQYPYRVAPLYLQVTAPPEPVDGPQAANAGEGLSVPVVLGPPEPEAGPHLSYAIQWFSFALIFLVGWVVVVVQAKREGDG